MTTPFELVQTSDRHRVALVGNTLLTVRRGAPVYEHVRAMLDVQKRLLEQPDPLGGLNVLLDLSLGSELALPESTRSIVQRSIALSQARRGGIAFVADVTGFAGAAARSFLSVLELAVRPVAPIRLFTQIDEAARWLAPRVARPGSPSADELRTHAARLANELTTKR